MSDIITVVTGFGRSGTSLLMQMLAAGGMPMLDRYPSFENDNAVRLPRYHKWLDAYKGKAVKILDPQNFMPPKGYEYRFIWTRRNYTEQAKSMRKFLNTVAGVPVPASSVDDFALSYQRGEAWALGAISALGSVLCVTFEALLQPSDDLLLDIQSHVQIDLNLTAMKRVPVKRSPRCLKGLLELSLMDVRNAVATQ